MLPRRVGFRFYSDDEIESISVKRITSNVSFDSLGHPVPNGLYDPALGPTDPGVKCKTCGLNYKSCPGHLGHICLSAPVYNPLLFNGLFKLLRCSCWSCHHFKISKRATRVLALKMKLISVGMVSEAVRLDEELMGTGGAESETSVDAAARHERIVRSYETEVRKRPAVPVHGIARDHKQRLIRQYFKDMPASKCANCGVIGHKLRQDGHAKIFRTALSEKDTKTNRRLALVVKSDANDAIEGKESGSRATASSAAKDASANFVLAEEAEAHMRKLFETERDIVTFVWNHGGFAPSLGVRKGSSSEIFFIRRLAVPPPRFRPPQKIGDQSFEHAQSVLLAQAISVSRAIDDVGADSSAEAKSGAEAKTKTDEDAQRSIRLMVQLQQTVNSFIDSSKAPGTMGEVPNGVRQLLEKKEGLFRMNMMGKRVNYAARSVISPDPNLSTHEIGVPVHFAKELTYAEPVTDWNVEYLRNLVVNGAHVHPGANFVEDENGRKTPLAKLSLSRRQALAKTLQTPSSSAATSVVAGTKPVKKVWRHLRSGDVMLVNRQPTLHKSSIMAHHARVLHSKNQVIRMHYANCNTYNADFDGDEINLHFPQNELARAEAYEIAGTMFQYVSAKDGKPLRGLIQDHIGMAVLLTKRDTFLRRDEYQQLVYIACAGVADVDLQTGAPCKIKLEPPAMLKPNLRWTGKQVITTILKQLLRGRPPFKLHSKSKVKFGTWGGAGGSCSAGPEMDESRVHVYCNELVRGVLDKSQLGHAAFGLIHAVFELYGARTAGRLLTAMGQLLTGCLKMEAHTCGLDDLVLKPDAERLRTEQLNRATSTSRDALHKFLFGDRNKAAESLPHEAWYDEAQFALRRRLRGDPSGRAHAELDSVMQGACGKTASSVIESCLPSGQYKSFPVNRFELMVATGSKGSNVNHSQISCLLGQQALEGRRVPLMSSGRSLPSFDPYDPSPRSGGFVADRFLTGVRPQEYFFHCMAGREGLIDTAVKTANSGYLQRCLIKHMEDLRVHYDGSVRNCDGSVVQFLYGDDGVDASRAAFLDGKPSNMSFLARNYEALMFKYRLHNQIWSEAEKKAIKKVKRLHRLVDETRRAICDFASSSSSAEDTPVRKGLAVLVRRGPSKIDKLPAYWSPAIVKKMRESGGTFDVRLLDTDTLVKRVPVTLESDGVRVRLIKVAVPDPVLASLRPARDLGAISESMSKAIDTFASQDPDGIVSRGKLTAAAFRLLMWVKLARTQSEPGESVGALAAQGIGEPSTQMTLNTFHLAGHGAVNVTLGIPRLREILMTASQKIKTPTMELALKRGTTHKQAEQLGIMLSKLCIVELLDSKRAVVVREKETYSTSRGGWVRRYAVRLKFAPLNRIHEVFGISWENLVDTVKTRFIPKFLRLCAQLQRQEGERLAQIATKEAEARTVKKPRVAVPMDSEDEDDDDSEEDGADDQGTLRFGRKSEVRGYADDSDVDGENMEQSSDDTSSDDDDEDETQTASTLFFESGGKRPVRRKVEVAEKVTATSATSKKKTGVVSGNDAMQVFDGIVGGESPLFAGLRVCESEEWVEIGIEVSPERQKLHLLQHALDICGVVDVWRTEGITRCVVMSRSAAEGNKPYLQTEGVNLKRIWSLLDDTIDKANLKTNDIGQVLKHYGVEAARAHIVEQVAAVFGVYGIKTDERHLGLVADYMCHQGGFRPMNRLGMDSHASKLLQMSFETTTRFLTEAAATKSTEALESPSARICLGQPIRAGTGVFDLLQPVAF